MCLDSFLPKPRPRRMHLKTLKREGGLSHHTSICLDANSASPKVRYHLPPGGKMAQGQRVTNLPLYPGRDLSASSYIRTGDCSCWIVQGAAFWLEKCSSGGVKIYLLSSPQAHLLKNLTHIPYSPSRWPSHMFFIFFFFVNILAH